MYFDAKGLGSKSTRDITLIRLLKSPGLMISASGISNTVFFPSDHNELCDRIKILLREKHAGNTSDKINKEIVVLLDKFLHYKRISKKQHKQIVMKCNLLRTKKK